MEICHDFGFRTSAGTLERCSGRLEHFEDGVKIVNNRNATPGPFVDEADFYDRALDRVACPVRRFTVSGHPDTILTIAQPDLAAYEDTRWKRFGLGKEADRTDDPLPEDVIALLDTVPDSRLIPEVSLWLADNPVDDWPRQVSNFSSTWRSHAATVSSGEIAFYRTHHEELVFAGLHEWCHLLEKRRPKYFAMFNKARCCDGVYLPDRYALVSPSEHWAVFGQNLIGEDGDFFEKVVRGGPLRSLVFMLALEDVLKNVPINRRSRCHDLYLRRIDYTRAQANAQIPALIEQITALLSFLSEHGAGGGG
jgi:hypothetical protein